MARPITTGVARLAVALAGGAATAQSRHALVVGNAGYTAVAALANPGNDARLMARPLREADFEVTLVRDADQRQMKREIAAFGRRLREAGPGAIALFHHAGHGVQAAGRSFLIPVDVDIRDEADLEIEAVPADWIPTRMESARTTNIITLDACRNNPFQRRFRSARDGGLARMNAPIGSFVAFSTAPGAVAADGDGRHSPCTAALARAIPTAGQPIEQMFKKGRIDVIARTGGGQTP
ncbi:MAG: caspase family protein [Pseudomonadota bacterium]